MYRLLIVEDEPLIAEGLVSTFDWKALGYEIVGVAQDGLTAEWLVELRRPDAVLTDIRMPEKDGLELLRFIKERYPDTQVVLLTAYAHFEYAREAVKQGAFRYVLKDDMETELEATFRELAQFFKHAPPLMPDCSKDALPGSDRMLLAARDYIDLNYTQELNLNDVAKRFYFNPSYFSRVFKQNNGLGFVEYIRRRRMMLARYLLVTTDTPISDVAQQVGYSDLKHFTDLFKREFGVKPSYMRKNII